MCGINGIFAYHYAANPVDEGELRRTRDHMRRRGPDGEGQWMSGDSRLGFGHRRLSIIDLSEAGTQPMASADGRFVITFNGEIYNYRELRRGLEQKGRVFRTGSDTEVLLHLFAEKGADLLEDLRGMYAFAIYDNAERRVFLARDPFGIKPLYYADDGWTLRFASQVKALIAGGAIEATPDPAGICGFFLFGSVPEPFTTVRAVRSLPAGTALWVDASGPTAPRRYHQIAQVYARAEAGRTENSDQLLREALRDSVRSHLTADVEVGAFLSAGVDSAALVGLMRDAGAEGVRTLTVGFEVFRGCAQDETTLAAAVAEQYGTRHTTRWVTRDEFEQDLPLILDAMDQPTIDGINVWFAAKAARELGLKVALSGLGADELLGGYATFKDIPRWVSTLAVPARVPLLGRAWRHAAQAFPSVSARQPKLAGLVELGGTYSHAYLLKRGLFLPFELAEVLSDDMAREGLERLKPGDLVKSVLDPLPRGAFARIASLESALYMRNQLLRDADWAGMAHGVEVRVPFVDRKLLETSAAYRGRFGKAGGKNVLASAPSAPLPMTVLSRPKTGFTTPVGLWMRGEDPVPAAAQSFPSRPWARDWSLSIHQRLGLATCR